MFLNRSEIYCRALSVATIYKTGIGLTTGFIGSHTVTHNYSVYTPTASQFTIVLAESPHCVFTGCLSSNI
jgi:hypothetical protein